MIPFSLEEIAALCPGRLDAAPWADEVTGVQIDSRRIEEGDLFVAVGGGEDFCRHAFARGAAATLVPEDAFAALAALGSAVRARSSARVVAHHRLDGQDLDEGHPGCALPPARAHGRRRGRAQQRDRAPADSDADRARHGGRRLRDGHARSRSDRRAVRDRAPRRRRDHEHRPGAPRAARHRRAGRGSEGGGRRLAARGWHGGRPGRAAARAVPRPRRHRDPPVRARERRGLRAGRRRLPSHVRSRRHAARAGVPLHCAAPGPERGRRAPCPPGARLPATRREGCEVELSRWRGEESPLPGGGLLINDSYNANPASMRAALEHLAERRGPQGGGARRDGRAGADGARLPPRGRRPSPGASASTSCSGSATLARDYGGELAVTGRAATRRRRVVAGASSSSPATPSSSRDRAPWASRSSRKRCSTATGSGPSGTSPRRGHLRDGDLDPRRPEVHRLHAPEGVRPAHPRGGAGGPPRQAGDADDGRPPDRLLDDHPLPRAQPLHDGRAHRLLRHARLRRDRVRSTTASRSRTAARSASTAAGSSCCWPGSPPVSAGR